MLIHRPVQERSINANVIRASQPIEKALRFFVSHIEYPMAHNNVILRFQDNGIIQELHSRISKLQRENNTEVLYTLDGIRIPLDNLLSINGLAWS